MSKGILISLFLFLLLLKLLRNGTCKGPMNKNRCGRNIKSKRDRPFLTLVNELSSTLENLQFQNLFLNVSIIIQQVEYVFDSMKWECVICKNVNLPVWGDFSKVGRNGLRLAERRKWLQND